MNKPIKPEITIPQSFAENGVKTDFDDTLLADGFDNLRPDVLAGDNLNKFIDDTYKGLNYGMAAADALNLINEGETLIVRNGEFTSGAAGGGGLEIGDIGIAPLGIDETKGKRRYLNGQVIIQDQYVQFTNKVKSAVALYPSLACTEAEWQTTATMTVGGQVGKFVIDDEAGTIRLPKIIMPIQGLTDLSKLGEIVEAGLPNIEGTGAFVALNSSNPGSGAFTKTTKGFAVAGQSTGTNYYKPYLDASDSNPIYGNSNTVQQEQIQYPYFIQVATGAETKDEIINEHELVNPYVLLEPKFFETPIYNLSWLATGGFNGSKAVHPSAYDALLIELNEEIEVGTTQNNYTKRGLSVKLATESYSDYDFVVDTANETFRPPLKVNLASSKAVVGNGIALGTTNGTQNLGLMYDPNNHHACDFIESAYGARVGADANSGSHYNNLMQAVGVTTDPIKSGIETSDSGLYLYFYVGETVQNANLINAGRIEEKLVDKADTNASNFTTEGKSLIASYGLPSSKYIDLTLGASGTEYTAPANGWVVLDKNASAAGQYMALLNISNQLNSEVVSAGKHTWTIYIPVKKGDKFTAQYSFGGTLFYFRFIYAEGEQ